MHPSLERLFDLSGTVAVVTGASRGLGVDFARGLTKAGADLVLTARSGADLEAVAADLRQYGHDVRTVVADVTKDADVARMIAAAVEGLGRLDILVNNAGIAALAPAEDMTEEQWSSVMDTNVRACFLCAQHAARHMLTRGSGKIINVASMYGKVASSEGKQVSYIASKWALHGLTAQLAVEWAPAGLHVTAISPGFFPTAQGAWAFEQDPELGKRLIARVPMGRLGRPEDLEGAIVFLASAASDFMNGSALILDGGYLSW
ncbi:MAG: short-chain dehydrogenase/reductase [Chloroflexi bacterium]|nr:short-chain dehydrogenase/reductase [Chloroflexota bacterium]